jgi:hypothetical protein
MTTPKVKKISKLFSCENCHYSTHKNSEYKKHLLTLKHINTTNYNTLDNTIEKEYTCDCGKKYNHRASLFNHKKKCNINETIKLQELILLEQTSNKKDDKINLLINEHTDFKNIIIDLVKSNSELQKQTLEMQQQMLEVFKNSNGSVNNSYNNNKTFNMQVFLNEKCKDAMNLTDFVNSMMLQFSDLEELGELGYVEGISRQMVRKLNEMDVYKRPIHCSDLKRETMYVRDDDVWEKETEIYEKLRKAIKYITKKNGDLMIPWRDAHPQCMKLEHPLNDTYLGIMNQAMGGKGEFFDSESKIIRKISKSVTIDKSDF